MCNRTETAGFETGDTLYWDVTGLPGVANPDTGACVLP